MRSMDLRFTYLQMGCVTIDGVMYSMRPYVRGALSRTPYPPTVDDINFNGDTYRLVPVELRLNFDDAPRPSRTSKSYLEGAARANLDLQKTVEHVSIRLLWLSLGRL